MKANYWEADDSKYVKNTGKAPAEWKRVLDDWRAESKTAAEIVAYLGETHHVPKWWSRAVATRYQVDKGIRPARGT